MIEHQNVAYVMQLAGVQVQGAFAKAFLRWVEGTPELSAVTLQGIRDAIVHASFEVKEINRVVEAINYLDHVLETLRANEAVGDCADD